jgi:hypothetical protein
VGRLEVSEAMSAPTFALLGSTIQGLGGVSVPWPAGHLVDDIGLLLVQTSNQAVTQPTNWGTAPSSGAGTGTAGALGSVGIYAFWRRAVSTAEADAGVADAGDHVKARILVFRGCENASTPFDVTASGVLTPASTAVSIPGVTTTGADRLVLACVANGTDINANQTTSGGFANANLTGLTRIMTSNTDVGNGGGIDVAAGVKATAGATGATTVTLNTSSLQALLTLALKAPSGAPPATVTRGGLWVATGVKAEAGLVSPTTAIMDAAATQAAIFFALKPSGGAQ